MPRRHIYAVAVVAALSALFWGNSRGAKPEDELKELYGVFVDAVEQVESNYVRPVDRKELLESALRGMLQDLDPHSSYFTAEEWKQFKKQIEGSYLGIGVSVDIDPRTKRIKVVSPLPGSPAYAAGILPGDQILEVDGKSTEKLTRDEVIELLQGRRGSTVELTVLHEGAEKTETLKVQRDIIEMESVLGDIRRPDDSWEFMLDDERKIGYIRIAGFTPDTTDDLKQALDNLTQRGLRGLVLDLRDDPGGLLASAVEVSDLFVEKGKIVSTKGRNQRERIYEAEEEGTYSGFPIVVMVNEHSASAAEIVAACLQDHGRAQVVGQRSFGKGSVQVTMPLGNGQNILKLTVATYWRPSGKNIHRFPKYTDQDEWGVSPDPGLEVKLSPDESRALSLRRSRRDLILNGKRDNHPPENVPEAREGEDDPDTRIVDKQLDKALAVVAEQVAEADAPALP